MFHCFPVGEIKTAAMSISPGLNGLINSALTFRLISNLSYKPIESALVLIKIISGGAAFVIMEKERNAIRKLSFNLVMVQSVNFGLLLVLKLRCLIIWLNNYSQRSVLWIQKLYMMQESMNKDKFLDWAA